MVLEFCEGRRFSLRPLSGLIILSWLTVYGLMAAAFDLVEPRARPEAAANLSNKGATDRAGLGNLADVKVRVDALLFPDGAKGQTPKEAASSSDR